MADLLKWDKVKTRKEHKCGACRRTFPKGSNLISAAWANDGTVYGYYVCPTCAEYWRKELHNEEVYFDEPIYGDDFATWVQIREQMEGEMM